MPTSGSLVTGTGVSGRVAFWSGTSTLSSDADLTFVTDTLTATKIIAPTSITISAMTAGSVIFAGTAGLLSQDNANFFWDDTNNDLLIGATTAPMAARVGEGLHIIRSGGVLPAEANLYAFGLAGLSTVFRGMVARGTVSLPSQALADDAVGLALNPRDNSVFAVAATARILLQCAETQTTTAHGSYITLDTTPTGSTTRAERFRVGPSGQWGIGGATFGSSGDIFSSGGASAAPTWVTRATLNAALDHGLLAGLTDDDHTQYALLAGRSGGQTLIGGTAAADDLTLRATAGVGAGSEFIIFQTGNNGAVEVGRMNNAGQFGIGQTAPTSPLHLTRTTSTAAVPAVIHIDGSFANAVDNNCGIDNEVTIASTASVGSARGFLNRPTFNPGAGATITDAYASQYQAKTGSGAGAITNLIAFLAQASYGTIKPSIAEGAVISDMGSASITKSVGIRIVEQTTATRKIDLQTPSVLLPERSTTPDNPTADVEATVYCRANKIIFQWNDGGTVRYKYLDLTGTGVTWVHTTTAPT